MDYVISPYVEMTTGKFKNIYTFEIQLYKLKQQRSK